MINAIRFEDALEDLASAEDFLDYFAIDYDPAVVHVNRLHILQRFHDYLARQEAGKVPDAGAYRGWLLRAYQDFVTSDARAEKVFAVFRRAEGSAFVPLDSLKA